MSRTGRPLALLGAFALLISAFLPWAANGRTAIDLGLLSFGDELAQPTVGLALIVAAGLPAVAALLDDHGWPRGISALAVGALVVVWLARGPDGSIVIGTIWAIGAACVLLVAAAVATPSRRAAARYPEQPADWTEAPGDDRAPIAAPIRTGGPEGPRDVGARRTVGADGNTTIEAWGPTRATCFGAAAVELARTPGGADLAGPRQQVPVRLEHADEAQALLSLAEHVTGLLRAGRVAVDADLFDTDAGPLVGYLEVVTTSSTDAASVAPVTAEVEVGDSWVARVTTA